MEEKMNVLYAKEAEFKNLSARADEIRKTRNARESELAKHKAKEGMEIAE